MSDVPRSLQSWASTIQTVVLTAVVLKLFINPGLALVEEKHAWQKVNIDEKYAATTVLVYPKGQSQNASLKQDQRYNTTQREHARVSVLWKQTYYYGRKQQEKVSSICINSITNIILPLLSLYLRRVWMIRNRYHGTYVNTSCTCQYREM